ncbi:MAG: ribosome silencing factor [Sedimentisphaeraceae bacterium JB056]
MSLKKNKEEAKDFVMKAAKLASERHCTDIVAMDLKGMSPATDYFLIATGTSNRQTRTVAEEIIAEGKKDGFIPFGRAGFETGNWILIDFVDVVVHLFDQDAREYYDLELLWGDAEKIELAEIQN